MHFKFIFVALCTYLLKMLKSYFQNNPASIFIVVDDLTAYNVRLLKSLKTRADVLGAWYSNGKIKYKMTNNDKTLVANSIEEICN